MTYSKADFARIAKVSKAAISQALKATPPRLLANAEGRIDADNPVNASWLAIKKAGIRSGATASPRKPRKPPAAPPPATGQGEEGRGETEDDDDADDGLKTKQLQADIRVKENNAERLSIGNAQKLEELVVRDRMRQRIGILGGEIRTRFLTLDARLAGTIHATLLSLLDPDALAERVLASVAEGGQAPEVASLIRGALGNLNPKSIREIVAAEVTKALKGAKEAAARADLDTFDPT